MVKRLLARTTLTLSALLLALLTAGAWLLDTESGNRHLLKLLKDAAGIDVEATISRPLWSGLKVDDLEVRWGQGHLQVKRIACSWRPWQLLRGHLEIERLTIDGVAGGWQAPPAAGAQAAPSPSGWPEVPAWLEWLSFDLGQLLVEDVAIEPPDGERLNLEQLEATLSWDNGHLSLSHRLRFADTQTLRGSWDVRPEQPALSGNLQLSAPQRELSLKLRLDENSADTFDSLTGRYVEADGYGAAFSSGVKLEASRLTLPGFEVSRLQGAGRAHGTLAFDWDSDPPTLTADLAFANLNLARETGWTCDLSGTVTGKLDAAGYRADLAVANQAPPPEQFALTARVTGNENSLTVSDLDGAWLQGELAGELTLAWQEQLRLGFELSAAGVDPAALAPELQGDISFDVQASLDFEDAALATADWTLELNESRLRGYPLRGRCRGGWDELGLAFDACRIENRDASLVLDGRLRERVELQLAAQDIADLVPGAKGSIRARGWLRHEEIWAGALEGEARDVSWGTVTLREADIEADADRLPERMQISLRGEELELGGHRFSEVNLDARGGPDAHEAHLAARWDTGTLRTDLAGKLAGDEWQGRVKELSIATGKHGDWHLQEPAAIVLERDKLSLGPVALRGPDGAAVDADLARYPDGSMQLVASWQALPLSLSTLLWSEPALSGTSFGELSLSRNGDGLNASTHLSARPTLRWDSTRIDAEELTLDASWDADGLAVDGRLLLAAGGELNVTGRSTSPGAAQIPSDGSFSLSWERLPLQLAEPWLPAGVGLAGIWQGQVNLVLQPKHRFRLDADGDFTRAQLTWQENGGEQRFGLENARASATWRDASLQAALRFEPPGDGHARAALELPLPAALPLDWQRRQPWHGELSLELPQLSPLAALRPELFARADGRLSTTITLDGTPQEPRLEGEVLLEEASAELIPAGIVLHEMEAEARLDATRLELVSLSARSGEGFVEGSGSLDFSEGLAAPRVKLLLQGERFTLLGHSDLKLLASPDLTLKGVPGRMSLTGSVTIPHLLINEPPPRNDATTPSDDVVITGAQQREGSRALGMFERLALKLTLGERVLVKIRGLDARLGGALEVNKNDRNELTGNGEIRVEDGRYATYGINLPIRRGQLLFAGGPLDNPDLDVLAEKRFNGVTAGVRLGGTLQKPQVRLISDPSMSDSDILSYLVLGRPLDETGSGDTDALTLAAGVLLSQAESAVLRDRLGDRLGIDKIEIERNQNIEETVIAVGKYLTPDIYVRYGQSVSGSSGTTQVRYQLNQNWQFETELGEVSGADLYYRFELP